MENKLGDLSHLFVTVFLSSLCRVMVIPAITDVTMSALCPGQDECSLAIYLSGVQQAVCTAFLSNLFRGSNFLSMHFLLVFLSPSILLTYTRLPCLVNLLTFHFWVRTELRGVVN
uniref:Hippocampus abundant transcript-like protein 1 n=1 Tax=Rhizophora mucronata TaxID=61149 RepID=A0A2P2LFE2_RHIMU